MTFKRLIALAFFMLAGLLPAAQASAQQAPDALVRDVTNEVLEIVRADKAIQAGDVHRVIELVDAKVLPHFDFRRMTMLAVGRDWREASPAAGPPDRGLPYAARAHLLQRADPISRPDHRFQAYSVRGR
jgi:phospholipid transport system substrate-binding protein